MPPGYGTVHRWQFYDPALENERPNLGQNNFWHLEWTVPINPREMSSPFPEKAVSVHQTTALDGRALLYEGSTPPPNWTFSGAILDWDHYWRLQVWSGKSNRIRITDHFGRHLWCYLLKFDPEPVRAPNRYWRHNYTMSALVLSTPTMPTVGI